ncbi:extensin-like [Penaeus chinensis]|uniref:extensin-like n=1 Tax=Penaeus chinensis TaxID=139456 RepID=UPI001FB5E09B|nr:extensin-like [Penaeus chinensis]
MVSLNINSSVTIIAIISVTFVTIITATVITTRDGGVVSISVVNRRSAPEADALSAGGADLAAEESLSAPIFLTIVQRTKEADYFIDDHHPYPPPPPPPPPPPSEHSYEQEYYPPPPPPPHYHLYDPQPKYYRASEYGEPKYNPPEFYHETDHHHALEYYSSPPPPPPPPPHPKHVKSHYYEPPAYHPALHHEPKHTDYLPPPPPPPPPAYHEPKYTSEAHYHAPDYYHHEINHYKTIPTKYEYHLNIHDRKDGYHEPVYHPPPKYHHPIPIPHSTHVESIEEVKHECLPSTCTETTCTKTLHRTALLRPSTRPPTRRRYTTTTAPRRLTQPTAEEAQTSTVPPSPRLPMTSLSTAAVATASTITSAPTTTTEFSEVLDLPTSMSTAQEPPVTTTVITEILTTLPVSADTTQTPLITQETPVTLSTPSSVTFSPSLADSSLRTEAFRASELEIQELPNRVPINSVPESNSREPLDPKTFPTATKPAPSLRSPPTKAATSSPVPLPPTTFDSILTTITPDVRSKETEDLLPVTKDPPSSSENIFAANTRATSKDELQKLRVTSTSQVMWPTSLRTTTDKGNKLIVTRKPKSEKNLFDLFFPSQASKSKISLPSPDDINTKDLRRLAKFLLSDVSNKMALEVDVVDLQKRNESNKTKTKRQQQSDVRNQHDGTAENTQGQPRQRLPSDPVTEVGFKPIVFPTESSDGNTQESDPPASMYNSAQSYPMPPPGMYGSPQSRGRLYRQAHRGRVRGSTSPRWVRHRTRTRKRNIPGDFQL